MDIPSLERQIEMLFDAGFQKRLNDGRVIVPGNPDYARWQEMHGEFERRLDRSLAYRWGFKTANPDAWPAFASMFLHGSTLHVIGNMIFLVALGFLVEYTLGASWFLALYVLSGLGANGLYYLLSPESLAFGVGASGAIAGLMGLYTVLFGFRPVRFFYFLWVYFDYIRAPAIALLPFWLGYEIYQYVYLSDGSNVNYAAHMGGILTGALLGLAVKHLPGAARTDYLDARPVKTVNHEQDLQRAEALLHDLRPEQALLLFESVLHKNPKEHRALAGQYRATRFHPEQQSYHQAAAAIFDKAGGNPAGERLILETFRDYMDKAKPLPRLSAEQARRLTDRFLATEHLAEAGRLIALGLRAQSPSPRLLKQGRDLAMHWHKQGESERAERLLTVLDRLEPAQADNAER